MVYRLDAVDAYERKLVKQIEVAAATVEDAHNQPYVRLLSTRSSRGTISARVELDVEQAGQVRRREVTVLDGDDLEKITGRGVYGDCRIGEISVKRGSKFMELRAPEGEHFLDEGEACCDVDREALHREMIRRTIREHLDKELRLRSQGIAVKVYAKLPSWFKVPTPLGSYNPDWAVLVDSDDGERLYLVVETKGTTHTDELRPAEEDKIKCGRAHFEALAAGDSPARYKVATSLDELLAQVSAD